MSPTQLTLKKLKADGWSVHVCERWNPWTKTRQDAWGFVDILAIRGDESLFIQATTGSNVSARLAKMRLLPAPDFIHNPPSRKVQVWGWAKQGPRGKRKVWTLRVVDWDQKGQPQP